MRLQQNVCMMQHLRHHAMSMLQCETTPSPVNDTRPLRLDSCVRLDIGPEHPASSVMSPLSPMLAVTSLNADNALFWLQDQRL